MKVCILGGSGFVGSHLVRLLSERLYQVRVLTRRRERAKKLIVLPTVQVVEADVHDPAQLQRQFTGIDAVINLVGILHGDLAAVHVELARKIAQVCLETHVPRLLHMSALNANIDGPSAYLRSKGQGERAVREVSQGTAEDISRAGAAAQFPRLFATVFRPSVIFGKEDNFLNLFARLLKHVPLIPLGNPHTRFQPVWVEDVARAFAESLEDAESYGKAYDLCGPRVYTLYHLVEFVANVLDLRRHIIGLSDRLSYLQAIVFEYLPGRVLTRDNYYSLTLDSVCSCEFPFGIEPVALDVIAPTYLINYGLQARYRWLRGRAKR